MSFKATLAVVIGVRGEGVTSAMPLPPSVGNVLVPAEPSSAGSQGLSSDVKLAFIRITGMAEDWPDPSTGSQLGEPHASSSSGLHLGKRRNRLHEGSSC
ncbi:unnamed protein product [Gadus morhua 'NCC']